MRRNSFSGSHFRRSTSSRRIRATWAAGPPNATRPSTKKSNATSATDSGGRRLDIPSIIDVAGSCQIDRLRRPADYHVLTYVGEGGIEPAGKGGRCDRADELGGDEGDNR